jgi:glycosyltransferase involved in cell wall biosynthesis
VDVYSGPSFIWAESVCWLLGRLGKPFVLTLHGGNLPALGKRWPRRVRRLLGSACVVTTPSPYLQQSLRPYRDDLLLLPNAVDLASYPFRLRSNAQPKLIWLRALEGIYNPCLALRAVAHLLEMGDLGSPTSDLRPPTSDLHLTMYGPDKGDGSLQKLKAEIQRLKLGEQVHWEGAVAKRDVPNALNSGDIFLNTTNVDNTPVSVIEAMACGLCVVSTNTGGLPYLLDDEQDSLLVQPDDSAAMAAAVRRILTEPGLAERLSRNARAKAEQYDWSVILPRWEQLLTEVAGNGPRDDRTTDN